MAVPFDPRDHLTMLSRRTRTTEGQWRTVETEYLEVKWRLAWLRAAYPDAKHSEELVHHDATLAIVRAHIVLPTGGEATGYGSESPDDWKDYLEKAATKATGRALAALGFGTQFCADFEFDEGGSRVVDAPVNRATTHRPSSSLPATTPLSSPGNRVPTTRPPATDDKPTSQRPSAQAVPTTDPVTSHTPATSPRSATLASPTSPPASTPVATTTRADPGLPMSRATPDRDGATTHTTPSTPFATTLGIAARSESSDIPVRGQPTRPTILATAAAPRAEPTSHLETVLAQPAATSHPTVVPDRATTTSPLDPSHHQTPAPGKLLSPALCGVLRTTGLARGVDEATLSDTVTATCGVGLDALTVEQGNDVLRWLMTLPLVPATGQRKEVSGRV